MCTEIIEEIKEKNPSLYSSVMDAVNGKAALLLVDMDSESLSVWKKLIRCLFDRKQTDILEKIIRNLSPREVVAESLGFVLTDAYLKPLFMEKFERLLKEYPLAFLKYLKKHHHPEVAAEAIDSTEFLKEYIFTSASAEGKYLIERFASVLPYLPCRIVHRLYRDPDTRPASKALLCLRPDCFPEENIQAKLLTMFLSKKMFVKGEISLAENPAVHIPDSVLEKLPAAALENLILAVNYYVWKYPFRFNTELTVEKLAARFVTNPESFPKIKKAITFYRQMFLEKKTLKTISHKIVQNLSAHPTWGYTLQELQNFLSREDLTDKQKAMVVVLANLYEKYYFHDDIRFDQRIRDHFNPEDITALYQMLCPDS